VFVATFPSERKTGRPALYARKNGDIRRFARPVGARARYFLPSRDYGPRLRTDFADRMCYDG